MPRTDQNHLLSPTPPDDLGVDGLEPMPVLLCLHERDRDRAMHDLRDELALQGRLAPRRGVLCDGALERACRRERAERVLVA